MEILINSPVKVGSSLNRIRIIPMFQVAVINMDVQLVHGIGVFFGNESNFLMKSGISYHQQYNHSHHLPWLVDYLQSIENILKIFYITIRVLKFGEEKILNSVTNFGCVVVECFLRPVQGKFIISLFRRMNIFSELVIFTD